MSQTAPLLQVEHLKVYYPVKGGVISHVTGYIHAVDDVSFSIDAGTTLGLVGESGCGKSTIGRQIVRLEKPTSGSIRFDGLELTHAKARALKEVRTQLQMVFQDSYSSLNPKKHVFQILADPIVYHGLASRRTVEQEVDRLLDLVGMPKNAKNRYPHEFSGGQRQRIAIAKALSLRPRLIVCDEPVSALDVSIQAQILNLFRQLQQELGLAYLFIGHGLGAVNYVSDRIAVMYLGQIVEIAEAKELFRNPAHPYTRALCDAAPVPDPDVRGEEGITLTGEVTSRIQPGTGCRFRPRCPFACPDCDHYTGALEPLAPGSDHFTTCRRGLQAKEGS